MIKVYTGKQGLGILFLFIAGMVLFLFVFSWGITKVLQLFLPLLIVLSYLLIVVFVLGFLPATYFKYLRPSLGVYSAIMSHALRFSTGAMSFFIVIKAFGILGILLVLSFKFLVPAAIAGAIFKGAWHIAAHLTVWISFAYGMKMYSQWLLNTNPPGQEKGSIIDVDAIEARNS
jgi:hypothetical protein